MSEKQFGKEKNDNYFHKPEDNKTKSNLCMSESSSALCKSESRTKSILNSEEIRPSSWDDSDEDFLSPTDWDSPTPRFKSLQADNALGEKILQRQNELLREIDRRQSPARIRRRTKSSSSSLSLLEKQNEFQATNNPEHVIQVGLDSWSHVTHFCANIQTKRFFCKTENKKETFDGTLENTENHETEQSSEKNNNLEALKNSFEKNDSHQCQIFTTLSQIIENEELNKHFEESRTLGNSTFDNELVTAAGSITCSSEHLHENSAHPEATLETRRVTDKIKSTLEIQKKNCFLQKSTSLKEFKNFKNSIQCKKSLSDGYLYTTLNKFYDSDFKFFAPKSEEDIISLKVDKNYKSSICNEIKNDLGKYQNNFHNKMKWLQNLKPRYLNSAKKFITSDESLQAVKICNKKYSNNPQFCINIDLSSCYKLQEPTLSILAEKITERFSHRTEVISQNTNKNIESSNSSLEQNTDHFYAVSFKNKKEPEPSERKAASCISTKVRQTNNSSGRIKTTENQEILLKKNSNTMTHKPYTTDNTHIKAHGISSKEFCTESEKFSVGPGIKRKQKKLSRTPQVHSCRSSKHSKMFCGNSCQKVKKRDRSLQSVRKFSSKSCTKKKLKSESFTTNRFSKSLENYSSNQSAQLILNSKKFSKNKNQTLPQCCAGSPLSNKPKINKSCYGETSNKSFIPSMPDDKNNVSKNENDQGRHRVKNNLTENVSVFDKNEYITNFTQNKNKSSSSFLKKTYETENIMQNISENHIHETKLTGLESKALTIGFRESASNIKNHTIGEKSTILSETFDSSSLKVLDVSLVTNVSHTSLESDSLVKKTPRSLFKFTKDSYEYAYTIDKNETLEKVQKNSSTESEQKETKIQTCFIATTNEEKPMNKNDQGDESRKINSAIKLKQSHKSPKKSWTKQNSTSAFIKKLSHEQETPFSKETCMFFNNLKISKSDGFMYKNIISKVSPEKEESTINKKCDINKKQKAINVVFTKYSSDSLQEPGHIEMKPLYCAPKIYLNSNVQIPKEESVIISETVNCNLDRKSSKISKSKNWLILKEEKHKKAPRKRTRQEFSKFRVLETELRTNWGSQNSMVGLKFKNSGCLQKFYKRFFRVFCITSGTSVVSTE